MLKLQNITDSEIALLYGVLIGDGCLSNTAKAYFISLTCDLYSDIPFITKIQPLLEKFRGKEIKPYERPK